MFCPFKEGVEIDDGEDILCEQGAENPYKQEVDALEKMIAEGLKSGAKCPFSSHAKMQTESANVVKDVDQMKRPNHELLKDMIEKSGGECPFKFAMGPNVDSEDEADMPKSHRNSEKCPAMKAGKGKASSTCSLAGDERGNNK